MSLIPRSILSSTVVRYGLTGTTGALIDIGLLYLLTDVLGIYYISSAILATTASFMFRFVGHKYFSFGDHMPESLHFQFFKYSLLYFGSMISTVALLYVFVEWFGLWYMAAQIITILLIASVSFFLYRFCVFKKQKVL